MSIIIVFSVLNGLQCTCYYMYEKYISCKTFQGRNDNKITNFL